jgi:hypothetical protein
MFQICGLTLLVDNRACGLLVPKRRSLRCCSHCSISANALYAARLRDVIEAIKPRALAFKGKNTASMQRPSLNATMVRDYAVQYHDRFLSPHPHGGNGRAFKGATW